MELKKFTKELVNRGFVIDKCMSPAIYRYFGDNVIPTMPCLVDVSFAEDKGLLNTEIRFRSTTLDKKGDKTWVMEDGRYDKILDHIDDLIRKNTPIIHTLNYFDVNKNRMTLPKMLTRFFYDKPEDIEDAVRVWKKITSDKTLRKQLTLRDHIFYSILIGKDWTKQISKPQNSQKRIKINNQLEKMAYGNNLPILFNYVPGLKFRRVQLVFANGPQTIEDMNKMWTYDEAPTTDCFMSWDKQDNN